MQKKKKKESNVFSWLKEIQGTKNRRELLNLRGCVYEKYTLSISHLMMKKPQYVSSKTETRQGYLLLTLSSNIVLKVLARAIMYNIKKIIT